MIKPRPAWRYGLAVIVGYTMVLSGLGGCAQDDLPAVGQSRAQDIAPAEIVVQPAQVVLRAGEAVQLTAQVNDGAAQPIGGAPLQFVVADATMLRISERGLLVAIGTAGETSVAVSSGRLTQPVRVTVMPGAASRIELAAGDAQSATAGARLAEMVAVKVVDAFGNGVPGATVKFEAGNGGSVQPDAQATDDRGMARVAWTLGTTAGTHMMRARMNGDATSVEATATARPGRARQLVKIDGDELALVAGGAVELRVQAQDSFGNPVPGAPVEWQVPPGAARIEAKTAQADASGTVEALLTTPPTAGAIDVTASMPAEGGRQSVTFALLTHAGPAATLSAIRAESQNGVVNKAVSRQPAVRVTDQNGNPVAGAAVEFTVTGGNGQAEGTAQVTDKDGAASVGRWVLGPEPGLNELQAAVAGVEGKVTFRATAKKR